MAKITRMMLSVVAHAIHRESAAVGSCGNACDHTDEARQAIIAYRRAERKARNGGRR